MAKDITITDVSGGMNEYDTPTEVPADQCVSAVNVEFVFNPLGERRLGAASVTVDAAVSAKTDATWLFRHLPTTDETAAELWVFAVTAGVSSVLYKKDTAWALVTPLDAIGIAGVEGFRLSGVSFNQKLFINHKSTKDRGHVWDGTVLRRVGLAAPTAAPTAVDTGAGTFVGTRYYRTRETIQVAGVTKLRSEPSPVLTKGPSGAGTGLVVTKPADMGESATHWELEASLSLNGDYYRIATTVVATTTVTDSVAFTLGYALSGTLSETSGNYTPPISSKFLSVDNDRIIMAGSWEQTALNSRVSWTVVRGDVTGVGNDERVPIATTNFLDLDTNQGGEITGLSGSINGYIYVTKFTHVYKLVRTGIVNRAYEAYAISKKRGAIEGSLIEGFDQGGNPCLYFIDPRVGPCQLGTQGLLICGLDISSTFDRVNINATTVTARGVAYLEKHQIIWWVAVDGGNTPTLKLVLHTDNMQYTAETMQIRRGWSLGTGPSATAISACLFASNINSNTARNLTLVPFIGRGGGTASVLRLDTGTDDAGTAFFGNVTTKAYAFSGILNRFGIRTAAVLAKAAASVVFYVRGIKNFGVENLATKSVTLTATGTETFVIKDIDDFNFSDLRVLQLTYGDDPDSVVTPLGTWEANQIALKPRSEEES